MKPAWFILSAVLIAQVAVWTFAPEHPPEAPTPPDGGRAYGDTEPYAVESRISQRQGAMAALDRPWSSRCGSARKDFLGGINEYYYQRQNQTERYPEIHGKLGADYIAAQWSTADDQRIDRLTQEAYAHGYLKPSDFDGVARKMVAVVIKDERITGSGCAS